MVGSGHPVNVLSSYNILSLRTKPILVLILGSIVSKPEAIRQPACTATAILVGTLASPRWRVVDPALRWCTAS